MIRRNPLFVSLSVHNSFIHSNIKQWEKENKKNPTKSDTSLLDKSCRRIYRCAACHNCFRRLSHYLCMSIYTYIYIDAACMQEYMWIHPKCRHRTQTDTYLKPIRRYSPVWFCIMNSWGLNKWSFLVELSFKSLFVTKNIIFFQTAWKKKLAKTFPK